MKELPIPLLPLLVLALILGAIGCGDRGEIPTPTLAPTATPSGGAEGALPILNVGDKWVSVVTDKGIEYTRTTEVIGEDAVDGKDCYVVEESFEPPFRGIVSSVTQKWEKATMLPTTVESSGEYIDMPYVAVISVSCEFPDGLPFPLEVGKEYKVIWTESRTLTTMGETQTEIATYVYTHKVEKMEQITVPAGTFRCFKQVKYDEDGTALSTSWYSDSTKSSVKLIDYETGDVAVLVSYSLR